jgi:hypothetical protein
MKRYHGIFERLLLEESHESRTEGGGMTARWVAFGFLSVASAFFWASYSTHAETCFHTCFREKPKSVDVDDQTLREDMQSCRELCEKEARDRLKDNGYAEKVAACTPEPVSLEDLKKIRSASPSVVGCQ